MGNPSQPVKYPSLDERERQIDERLARASGKTAADIHREARRRALTIEVESIRRDS